MLKMKQGRYKKVTTVKKTITSPKIAEEMISTKNQKLLPMKTCNPSARQKADHTPDI